MKKVDLKRTVFSRIKKIFFVLTMIALAVLVWRDLSDSRDTSKMNAAHHVENSRSNEKANDSPIFDEFDFWIKQYLNGASSSNHLSEGERLAAARREALRQLIETNPRAALERAVSEEIYSRLPAEIARYLEKRVSAKGDFIVQIFDEIESEKSIAYRTTREVVFGETKYKAFVYGRKAMMTTKLSTLR